MRRSPTGDPKTDELVRQLVAASGGFMGTLFLVPLLLQSGLGFSALHSGLATFTEALGGMTGTQVTSRIYKRVGPRRLMIAGMSSSAATIVHVRCRVGPASRAELPMGLLKTVPITAATSPFGL